MALTELPISTRAYDIDGITGIQRDNVKTLMGDTDLTYVVGSPFVVTDGQIIRTRAEGLAYEVAAHGATDQHVTTAGGVKLYILPERHHPSRRQTQKLMQKLERGENCHIVVAGDSTGNENDKWVYVLAQKIATDYPAVTVQHRLWSTVTNDYGAAVTIQTGTGAGTMIVWNASTTGGKPDYFAGQHLLTAFRPVEIGGDPDLVMFSYGHSGSDLIEDQYPGLAVITGDVSRHMPTAPIILIGQNPNLNDTSMQTKTDAFRALAAAQGYGYIDVHFFFQKYLSPLSGYYDQSDPVHPSAVGSSVWATIVHMAFGLSNDEPVGNLVSSQNRGVVYQAGRYTDLEKVSIVGATRSRSSTEYETSGESMQLTGNGTSGGDYVHVNVITPQDIRAYNGRYVTALVRVKVASGSGANAGRIQLTDGVAEATTLDGGPQGNDWYSQAVSMKVSDDATSLELRVLLSSVGAAGGSTDTIFVDRIVIVDGLVPGDKAIADAAGDFTDISVTGDIDATASTGFFSDGVNPIYAIRSTARVAIAESATHNLATDGSVTGGSFLQSFSVPDPILGGTQTIADWDYFEDTSQVFGAKSGQGMLGLVSRTSSGAGPVQTIKVGMVADTASTTGAAAYIDAIRASTTSTIGTEINTANLQAAITAPSPYAETANEIVNVLRLGAGSDSAVFKESYPIGSFIQFINNGAKAQRGMNFEHNSLVRDDETGTPGEVDGTGYGMAMSMAYNQGLSWWSRLPSGGAGTQTEVARLRSTVTNSAVGWRAEFTDTAFIIGDTVSGANNYFIVRYDASAVNGMRVIPSDTGQPVKVEPAGSDKNINFLLRGKGTGLPGVQDVDTSFTARFDPSDLTASRTYTLPDITGKMVMQTTGTYTVNVTDSQATPNVSATTATGDYTRTGDEVTVYITFLGAINTAGLTGTDVVRITLPFDAQTGSGESLSLSGMTSVSGAPDTLYLDVSAGVSYGVVTGVSYTGTRNSQTVANISGGVLQNFTMTYKAVPL